MRKLSIFAKLFLSIFLVSSLCVLTFGLFVYFNQKNALIERTSEQLRSVNILKKKMVEKRLDDDEKFIWHFVRKVMLFDSTKHFLPEKEFKRHKDFLRDFCKDYGHLDVLLLNENEEAVDSLYVGNDYGELSSKDQFSFVRVFLIDNSHYRLALVTSTDYLQKLLFENTGMGQSGESYLVGPDFKMISKSRFFPEKPPHEIVVKTSSAEQAVAGAIGLGIVPDYRGIDVLSAFGPIEHKGLRWALLSEMDLSEAMQPVMRLRSILFFISLFVIIAALGMAVYLGKQLVNPIRKVSKGMVELSKGNIPAPLLPPFYHNEESLMKVSLNGLIDSFDRITRFAKEIGSGNLNAHFQPLGEKDELGRSLLHMRNQLKEYQEKEKSLIRQKSLSLLEGQENERRRIARDLHDGLGQWLTGLKLRIASVNLPEDQREELKAMVSETINETRRLTNNLMPNSLVDFGLDAALRNLVSNVQKGNELKVEYAYHHSAKEIQLPFEVTLTLYRIAQEGLNNILKHAQALKATLLIEELEGRVEMSLEDDGIGIPEIRNSGNGLGNMEERAKLIQGQFILERKPKGTRIRVEVPLT